MLMQRLDGSVNTMSVGFHMTGGQFDVVVTLAFRGRNRRTQNKVFFALPFCKSNERLKRQNLETFHLLLGRRCRASC